MQMTPILYQHHQANLSEPIFVKLINCVADTDYAKFAERFGVDDLARLRDFAKILRTNAVILLNPDLPERFERWQKMFKFDEDLLYVVNASMLTDVSLEPRLAKLKDGNVHFVLVASTLHDFMAFELAAAFQVGARTKRCEHCNKLFLHGPLTERRSSAKYCADRCRVAALRARNATQGDQA